MCEPYGICVMPMSVIHVVMVVRARADAYMRVHVWILQWHATTSGRVLRNIWLHTRATSSLLCSDRPFVLYPGQVFRALIKAQFVPDRTVEFHAYAAEEVGLRGSQAIAQAYAK